MVFGRPFVLAAALAAAGVPHASAQELDDPIALAITVVDLRELPREVLHAAWSHASGLLDRLGARLRIRWAQAGDVQDPGGITVVVMPGRPAARLKATVLGAVQPAGAPRVLWLFPEVIADALDRLPGTAGSPGSPKERAALAVALGRVAAHEIVHLVCPWRPHDREGLMAARMSPSVLRGGPLVIDDDLRRDFALGVGSQAAGRRRTADAGSTPIL
jgi:hypothetical protein